MNPPSANRLLRNGGTLLFPYQFTRQLLQETPVPTGWFAIMMVALIVLEAFYGKKGVKVPEEISLVSFDDSRLAVASEVKLTE